MGPRRLIGNNGQNQVVEYLLNIEWKKYLACHSSAGTHFINVSMGPRRLIGNNCQNQVVEYLLNIEWKKNKNLWLAIAQLVLISGPFFNKIVNVGMSPR
jgi:hypothetical protein